MSHSNTVTNSDCREYNRNTACKSNALLNGVNNLIYIHMSRNDIVLGTYNTDKRFLNFFFGKTESIQKRTLRCGTYAVLYN